MIENSLTLNYLSLSIESIALADKLPNCQLQDG